MKIRIIAPALLSLIISFQSEAQSVVGFWGVTSVKVGDRTMTPVAKWFRNNEDGTFESGNGWTQNSYGTWAYDEKTNEFIPTNKNGIKDEFGPFVVSFSKDGMTWERDEEGMKVVVSLVAIDEMSMAPIDQIPGLWSLSSVKKEEKDITLTFDSNAKQFIHIRPDMRFRLRKPDETFAQGFWHMDGHRPEFTLIDYDREIENQVFSIDFDNDHLIMKQKSGDQLIFIYERIDQFPE